MRQRLLQLFFLIFTLALLVGAVLALRYLWQSFAALNPELGAALVTGFFTVTVSIVAVVLGRYFEKAKEVGEVYREKRQKVYEEFIEQFLRLSTEETTKTGKSDQMVKFLREFNRKIILWAGPHTVRAYVDMMLRLNENPTAAPSVFSMETFYKAMRRDLGLSNAGIQRGDLLALVLRLSDLRDFLAASTRNPNITLSELAEQKKAAHQGSTDNSGTPAPRV